MTATAKLNVTSSRIQNVRTLRDRRGASGPAITTGRTDASATVAAHANIGMMTTAWATRDHRRRPRRAAAGDVGERPERRPPEQRPLRDVGRADAHGDHHEGRDRAGA